MSTKPDYFFQTPHPTDPYADPIQGSGDLDAALAFAQEHNADITMYDRPGYGGFIRGWVHADGNYTLN